MTTLDTAKNYSSTIVGLGTQLALTTAVSVFSFAAFEVHRRWKLTKHLYINRCILNRNPSPLPSETLFGWVWTTMTLNEEFYLSHVGLDAAMYIRYLKMAFQLMLFSSIIIGSIILPLNFFAQETILDQIEKVSIGNIPVESKMLWVHWIMTHFFSFYVLYLLNKNSRDQAHLRIQYLQLQARKGCIHTRTVMVTRIPRTFRHEQRLRVYFGSLGIGDVESVVFVRQVSKLTRKIKRMNDALQKLERCHISLACGLIKDLKSKGIKAFDHHNLPPEKASKLGEIINQILPLVESSKQSKQFQLPTVSIVSQFPDLWELICRIDRALLDKYQDKHGLGVFRTGTPVITIDYMLKKFNKLEQRVAELRSLTESASYYKPTNTAFVTFQTQVSAQLCAQSIVSSKPDTCHTRMAPEPRDLLWSNLTFNSQHKLLRKFFATCSVWTLTILWLFPSTYFVSFASYNRIVDKLPWIKIIETGSPWIKNLIETMLPSILISLFMVVMPTIILGISSFESFPSYSQLEMASINRYYQFAIFNVLFVFLLGFAFIDVILAVIQSPTSIVEVLANNIPKGAAFFINYVILQTCSHGLEILQVGAPLFHCYIFANSWASKTPRELQTRRRPWAFPYYYYLPMHLLILVICITYSIINPLILFFGTIYFGIALVVYKYQFAFAYVKHYEANGKIWKYIFRYVSHGLLIFQLTMLGVISLRNSFASGMALIPLLGCTVYFIYYCRKTYREHTKYIPLDALYEREEAMKRMHSPAFQAQPSCVAGNRGSPSSSNHGKQKAAMTASSENPEFTNNPIPSSVLADEDVENLCKENHFESDDSNTPGISVPDRRKNCPTDFSEFSATGTYPSWPEDPFSSKHFEYGTKSPVKQKLIKIQNQIFSTPLLSLLWQPTSDQDVLGDNHADPKEILIISILPNREIYQDDINPFESYLHPDLIRPLPRSIWLPRNPYRHLYDLNNEMRDLETAITSSTFVPSNVGGDSTLGFGERTIPTVRQSHSSREAHTGSNFPSLLNSVRSITSKSTATQCSLEVVKFQGELSDVSGSTLSARSTPASGLINLLRAFSSKATLDHENASRSRSINLTELPDHFSDGPLSEYGSRIETNYSPRSSISSGKSV